MTTDLATHIQSIKLVDTHEHLAKENDWLNDDPDILQDLFNNYVPADLITAGATHKAIQNLMDKSNPDLEARFKGIEKAWRAVRFTGYGEAVRLIAKQIYGFDELNTENLIANQHKTKDLCTPGERYRLLNDVANLDHVQTDDFCWECYPDQSGLDFFFYDLSWVGFCNGQVDPKAIAKHVEINVTDLNSLRNAMSAIFEKYAPIAIAVKSQHAYNRTLAWSNRSDLDAENALQQILRKPSEEIDLETRLCLGDWAWARGVELSIEHKLPFKIHTGYYAGNNNMPVDRIPAGRMCALFKKYLDAKFVLMHIAYPYSQELIALAKHYRNIWVDLCWAWSIDPFSSRDFLRRFIHAVPINKLFAFGGDTRFPTSSLAYAIQARREIQTALEAEIADGYLTEKEAMQIATAIMRQNQYECFEIESTRNSAKSQK